MKIAIAYEIRNGPWGGGNQFLKVLKQEFESLGVYEKDCRKADAVIFNSHHNLDLCSKLKKSTPAKIIIHRIDGPILIKRSKDKPIDRIVKFDKIIKLFNDIFADGTIYQSNWSKEQNKKLFSFYSNYETVIYNASDNKIFNRVDRNNLIPASKIKLIATSWSSDWNRGFDIYGFLDKCLDFSKYEMSFVGNSPVGFKNIKVIDAVNSEKLAEILKTFDIYVTADKNSACSNSLIEAMCCGLPAVALNSGSNAELVKYGGLLFNDANDIIEKIEEVSRGYNYYQSKIAEYSIKDIAMQYYGFAERIFHDVKKGKYIPKKLNFVKKFKDYRLKLMVLYWKFLGKIKFLNQTRKRSYS